jgi:hypothetical protein
MKNDNANMYSGTPCTECGGPTLTLGRGSIWCPAEDPHPGGFFVTRVAFERSPLKEAKKVTVGFTAEEKGRMRTRSIERQTAKPRESKPVASPYGGGMDDFVESK